MKPEHIHNLGDGEFAKRFRDSDNLVLRDAVNRIERLYEEFARQEAQIEELEGELWGR